MSRDRCPGEEDGPIGNTFELGAIMRVRQLQSRECTKACSEVFIYSYAVNVGNHDEH